MFGQGTDQINIVPESPVVSPPKLPECVQISPKARGGVVAWWLSPRTPDPEVEGSSPTRVAVLCP